MHPHISAAVLVGGQNARFGRDKALLTFDDETLVERIVHRLATLTDDVLVVGNRIERFAHLCVRPARIIRDRVDGMGALGGAYTALLTARHPHVLIVGCGMPFLNVKLMRYLCAQVDADDAGDVVMPQVDGVAQPLHAVYGATALPAIRQLIDHHEPSILALLPEVRVRVVTETEIARFDRAYRSFYTIDTPEDLERIRSLLAAVV